MDRARRASIGHRAPLLFRPSRDPRRGLVSGCARGIFCCAFSGLPDTTSDFLSLPPTHPLSLFYSSCPLFNFFINPVSFCFSVWSLSRPVSSSLSVLGRPTSWCQDVLTSVCCRCHCGRLKRWSTIFFWVVDNRWHSIYWILGFVCVCIRGGG